MKRFIVCVLASALMTACADKKSNVVINVSEQPDKTFPIYDYFQVDKTVYVNVDDEHLLSDVNSAYMNGDYIYTLDSNHKISKIDLNTGNIISQYCQIGRGPKDYIFPIGLTGDDRYLYLLDLMGKAVHKFSYDLKHQGKFSLENMNATSSMFKTQDGFIFFNSFDSEDVGKFAVTDNEGQIKQSFIHMKEELQPDTDTPVMKTIFTDQLFVQTPDGKVLCFNPDGNEAYLYDGNDMDPLLRIVMDMNYEKQPQTPNPFVKQLFSVNGNILVSYSYNMETYFGYYDNNFKLIATGNKTVSDNQAPFSPICQVGEKLITALPTDDTPGAVIPGRSVQAQIIIHSAKRYH